MKSITEYILEEKLGYELSADYKERTVRILNDLVGSLPELPGGSYEKRYNYPDGEFWFNDADVLRSPAESANYKGNADEIHLYVDTKKHDIGVDSIKDFFKSIFGAKINEGIFNVSKDPVQYEWVKNLHNSLSNFFGTKDFSKISYNKGCNYNWPAGIYKKLRELPTVKKDGLYISLYSIDLSQFKSDYPYSKITIVVFVYEEKDPAKLAEIKAHNNALKPLDIVGRELMSGDTVAYALMGGYGKYDGMQVGVIDSVSKEMVKVDGKGVRADRCCLISRKDGKRIE